MNPESALIHDDETLTDLQIGGLKVLQKKQGFRFAIDAVLLAHFVQPKAHWRICDLGTGTAVIPLLLSANHAHLTIDAVELQPQMAEMAKRTLALNQLDHIRIHEADLRRISHGWRDSYNAITCNPPYFPIGSGKQNPIHEIALARHELACTLEDVISCAARLLKSGGHLYLIHRASRLDEIFHFCQRYQLTPKRLRLIHPYRQQEANLLLLDAVKGAKPALTIEAPLIVYDAPQEYSWEILQYYGGEPLV